MKVVILAGGFGTRLNEYTKTIPKPRRHVRSRRSARQKQETERRKGNWAVMSHPNFSIKKVGRTFTLTARSVTEGVLSQIRSFLKKTGKPLVDGEKMTKKAAFRYISTQLRNKPVQVRFQR